MRNSKLIALLSAGALVASSLSGLTLSNNALAAGSRAVLRKSDGYFRSVVTYTQANPAAGTTAAIGGANTAPVHKTVTSTGVNREIGKLPSTSVAANPDYTGFLKDDFVTKMVVELNDAYQANAGYARDNGNTTAQQAQGGFYNYIGDRTDAILNQQITAIWQKGYVGDTNITTYLEDPFEEESEPSVAAGDSYILLQSNGDANAPSYDTIYAELIRAEGYKDGKYWRGGEPIVPSGPETLRRVGLGKFAGAGDHGVALWGVAEDGANTGEGQAVAGVIPTHKITLALDAKIGHYTKWDGYIFVGDSGADDDGEYLPVHIAYPEAVYAKNNVANDTWYVTYGGEYSEYALADVIVKDLPHDQWVWVIKDDNTNSFVFENGERTISTQGATTAKVKATDNATKGATCRLELYNTSVSQENYVWDYDLKLTSPNFYTDVYLRADKDIDGNGVNYADGTYTTANNKAEIRATATMLINEGLTDISQNQITWTWTAKEKNDNIKFTPSGVNNNIGTFEVANMDTVQSVTYIVRAYAARLDGQGDANFLQGQGDTNERMYGSRTITVVFDKDFVPTITTDALPVGTGFTVEDGYYVVTSDTEVEFAKYVGTATSYTVPSQVTFGNFTYNVTSVGKKAFASKTQLKEVTVPESVTVLGNGAFKNCKKLTSVTFLGNITNTPKNVFLKAGAKNGKKLKVSVGAGTSEETIKGLKKSNKNAKIK